MNFLFKSVILGSTALLLASLPACSDDPATGSGGSTSGTTTATTTTGAGGAGGGSSTSTGTGGAAPVDCANPAENPILGTCYATFFACFAPTGTCTFAIKQNPGSADQDYTWSDGSAAKVSIKQDATGTITFTGKGGAACVNGTIDDKSKAGGDTTSTLQTAADPNATLLVVAHKDDSIDITCPDKTTIKIPAEKHHAFTVCDPGNAPLLACE